MSLPLWALCGRIWVEDDNVLRYALSFGDPATAKAVRKRAGNGQVVKGHVRWAGRHVPAALNRAGAPHNVVALAQAVVGTGPGRGVRRQPSHDEAFAAAIEQLTEALQKEVL